MSSSATSSNPAVPHAQARTLLTTFTTFLTITLHTILYHRQLYPKETFLLTKHHNLAVPQSRHPGLCSWINDSVAQIQPLLAHGRLAKVCINLHFPDTLQIAERWLFDVRNFPAWIDDAAEAARRDIKGKSKAPPTWEEREKRERRMQKGNDTEVARDEAERQGVVNWADVDEGIRGALQRIAYAAEAKDPLPEESTFTLAVELRDEAPAPTGHPQPWIPAETGLQSLARANLATTTTPIRNVQAGPLFFECWIEEGKQQPDDSPPDKFPTPDFSTQDSEYP